MKLSMQSILFSNSERKLSIDSINNNDLPRAAHMISKRSIETQLVKKNFYRSVGNIVFHNFFIYDTLFESDLVIDVR